MTDAALAEDHGVFRTSFDRLAARRAQSDPPWLIALRSAAMARFAGKGFPTTREEAWRKTSVSRIARTAFQPADGGAPGPEALRRVELPGFRGPRAVFVNGRFSAGLSSPGPEGRGLEVLGLKEVLAREPARLEPWLGRVVGDAGHVFADLNAAFLEDGAAIFVAPGAAPGEPLQLVYLSTDPGGAPTASFPRTLVVAGRGSESRIVESYGGPDGAEYLADAVTEVVVEDGASVDHYKLQREGEGAFHVSTTAVRLGRDARFSDHAVSLGAALSRNDIDVLFTGEGGECVLNGLFLADGERHTDTHTRIDHAVPHCASRELYKGILDGSARGVFDGLIVVRPGAQKTDAWQTNKNLLLSRRALVDSTPRLEILADDVKCRHGSTTGQLDPTALYYLRSRGIAEPAARALLTYAFASDLVHRIRVEPLRAAVEGYLQARLPSAGEIKEAFA
ncbi:MAG TPA: Fe-S cluster assembly protein SufD [Vicinamibacteria bacterium]|nr:Fe-S cluster assembly protein SufD [Vicinamibacteria bacterium]